MIYIVYQNFAKNQPMNIHKVIFSKILFTVKEILLDGAIRSVHHSLRISGYYLPQNHPLFCFRHKIRQESRLYKYLQAHSIIAL